MHRYFGLRAGIALLLTLGLALAACQPAAPPTPTPRPVPPTPTPRPEPPDGMLSPDYGIQLFLWGNPGSTDRELRLAKEAGFRWVKQMFQWNYIEGKGKGQFEWNEPDRIVRAVNGSGLKLIARIDFSPMWAQPKGADPNLDGPPAKMQDLGDFLAALAARYAGKVQAYQIWNEPNLARDWGGRSPRANEYVEMLKIAYKAIKNADPKAAVISAGLSPTTATGAIARPDTVYLKEMYEAGARDHFDFLGVHGAGYKAPPDADPGQVAKDPALTNNDPSPESARRIYAFRHVEDLRQVMVDQGDAKKRVVVLEFGWTSDQRPDSPYRWHGVTEAQKAEYIVGAFRYAREHWQPWIAGMNLIYFAAPHWTPKDEQYYWSITDEQGHPRPAYNLIKQMPK